MTSTSAVPASTTSKARSSAGPVPRRAGAGRGPGALGCWPAPSRSPFRPGAARPPARSPGRRPASHSSRPARRWCGRPLARLPRPRQPGPSSPSGAAGGAAGPPPPARSSSAIQRSRLACTGKERGKSRCACNAAEFGPGCGTSSGCFPWRSETTRRRSWASAASVAPSCSATSCPAHCSSCRAATSIAHRRPSIRPRSYQRSFTVCRRRSTRCTSGSASTGVASSIAISFSKAVAHTRETLIRSCSRSRRASSSSGRLMVRR